MKAGLSLQKVLLGMGMAVAGVWIAPIIKRNYPDMSRVVKEGLNLTANEARRLLAVVREEAEDILIDAQFERMKRALDRELQQ